jgi:hypothetical protein
VDSIDQRDVPVIFYGAGVKKGGYKSPATPADIAPSLGALAGIPFRTTDGHERSEAFATAAPTR